MSSPTIGGMYSVYEATQADSLDGLLTGSRWGSGGDSSTTTITYSFPDNNSVWSTNPSSGYGTASGDGEPWNGFLALTPDEQDAVRSILQQIENFTNAKFVEINESSSDVGDIRLAFSGAIDATTAAYAYSPAGQLTTATEGVAYPAAGDIWINVDDFDDFDVTLGTYDYLALVHEIGHALGFKHPFEDEGDFSTVPASLDSYDYTVMSYSPLVGNENVWMSCYPTTYMSLDVAALQYLYGINDDYHTGNDTYIYQANNSYNEVLWDAGGIDTLIYDATGDGAVVDLSPGAWQALGKPIAYFEAGSDDQIATRDVTVHILDQVVIENAIGGLANDSITGNATSNLLAGRDGDDVLNGMAGDDKLFGGDGNDILDGGEGVNDLVGGSGSDTYILHSITDKIIEVDNAAEDHDLVISHMTSYRLSDNIENGAIYASSSASMTGNASDNTIYAGSGNNVIDGDSGIDTVDYSLSSKAVKVSLAVSVSQKTAGSGSDTFISIENLSGSTFDDKLAGNDSVNIITGGEGRDQITGGGGGDVFTYTSASDSSITGMDTITDFRTGADRIDLSKIDADTASTEDNAFVTLLETSADFSEAGQLRFSDGILYGNMDSDGDAEFAIKLSGVSALTLNDIIA